MKNLIKDVLFGKNSMLNGLIALSVIAVIGLGCFCNKDRFNLSNTDQRQSNVSDAPVTPDATPDRTYTKADASRAEMPTDAELQDIVKTTLLDFNSAIQQRDFSEFYETICKPWKSQITPEKLRDSFQVFIDRNINISDIAPLDAEFSPAPEISREAGFRTLKVKGRYPTRPQLTKFELNYIPEGKDWKLSKIVVDTTERAR